VGSKAYDRLWGTALRTTTILHKAVYSLSGGRLGRHFPGGAQVVWITTLGRKSGEWRKTPLLAVPDSGGWGIAGSNAGQEKIPGWVFNVRAHDQGRIEIDGEVSDAVFTEVHGEEASRIYSALGDSWSSYRMYERNIERDIPVFRVTKIQQI
jgi:deazaflavin-dependent oxidoreductase (nitroreductase family)